VKKCEAKHESTSEVEDENKNEAANQRTHLDRVSSIFKAPLLNSLTPEAKLI
jgi:hypothetical protein